MISFPWFAGRRRRRVALDALAEAAGLRRRYTDAWGKQREASEASVRAALRALGVMIDDNAKPRDLAAETRRLRAERAARLIEPVIVAWDGALESITVRTEEPDAPARVVVTLEGTGEAVTRDTKCTGGRSLRLGLALPHGRHAMEVSIGARTQRATVIAAPSTVFGAGERRKVWGPFLPLHALRTEDDWGTGDLSGLRRLASWTASVGGELVGTLPLYACFLDEPLDPSPYAPISRLFWNELFADIGAAEELAPAPAAREALASHDFQRELADLRQGRLVDYRRAYQAKARVLDPLSDAFFESGAAQDALRDEQLVSYATFRGAVAKLGPRWREWPDRQRSGTLTQDDADERVFRRHLYAQVLMRRQLERLADDERAAGLYLDFPVGSHAHGFDAWSRQSLFASGLSVGAPPDPLFTGGQSWGFPPMHPQRVREQGHAPFSAELRALMRHASCVRIDHVMGLHRLYCVPDGFSAKDGVYLEMPAEEQWAVVCLESHRMRCGVVGENLGTVPPEVQATMEARGALGMHVAQFSFKPDPADPVEPPPARSLASLNTHDTPTFAGYWHGDDIALWQRLGLMDAAQTKQELAGRAQIREALVRALLGESGPSDPADEARLAGVLGALQRRLASSDAAIVLVSLEDLWLEREPQNVPGTSDELANWRRRAARTMDSIERDGAIESLLDAVHAARAAAPQTTSSATPLTDFPARSDPHGRA